MTFEWQGEAHSLHVLRDKGADISASACMARELCKLPLPVKDPQQHSM